MFYPTYTGLLGSNSHMDQVQGQAAQHALGNLAPLPASSGAAKPQGGQNNSADSKAGLVARNSTTAGASDAVADNNPSAFPQEIAAQNTTGCEICEECFKRTRPRQWGQAWADCTHNARGGSRINPATNWPGSDCFTFQTDDSSGGGYPALGLVFAPTGHAMLVFRFSESSQPSGSDATQVKVLVLDPKDWSVAATLGWELDQDQDRKFGDYLPDSAVFFDNVTSHLTVFPRVDRFLPPGVSDTDQATVLTLDGLDPVHSQGQVNSSITVNDNPIFRYTATGMNVAGPFMCKGNMAENASGLADPRAFVYLYLQNNAGMWSPGVAVNWMEDLLNSGLLQPVNSGSNDPPFYDPGFGRITGIGPRDGFNYGLPFIRRDCEPFFCGLASAGRFGNSSLGQYNSAGGIDETKVLELKFSPLFGSTVEILEVYAQEHFTQADALVMSTSLQFAADQILANNPFYQPFLNVENLTTSCTDDGVHYYGPFSYQKETSREWLGVIYEDFVVAPSAWDSTLSYWPGRGLTAPLRGSSIDMGVPKVHLSDRYIATSTGWRYGAMQVGVPLLVPSPPYGYELPPNSVVSVFTQRTTGAASEGGLRDTGSFPFEKRQVIGGFCFELIKEKSLAGYIPCYAFAFETVLFAISPDNVPSLLTLPGQRHEIFQGDPEIPIPEPFFQVLVAEEINRAFWLHGFRDSAQCAGSAAMISVTEADNPAGGVLWTIPASEFFPLTKFTADQTSANPNLENPIWAREGEYQYGMLGQDGRGPQMKLVRRKNGQFYLLLGVEYYDRAEPHPTDGFPADDTFVEANSQGGDQITFNLSQTPVIGIDAVYRNGDPGDPLGYTWNSGDDFVTLDDPLVDPDQVTIEYHFGDPSAGSGETVGKSLVILVDANGYSIESISQDSAVWHYPDIQPCRTDGQNIMRLLAIGPDRIVYVVEDGGSHKLRQVLG